MFSWGLLESYDGDYQQYEKDMRPYDKGFIVIKKLVHFLYSSESPA